MSFQLPDWPQQRLLREAVMAWNLRHPRAKLDPVTSPWRNLYVAVLAFCRHDLTAYNRMLSELERDLAASGQSDLANRHLKARNALRKAIHAAAARQYPWLRPETDPRKNAENFSNGQKHRKVLNEASAQLADLIGLRAHLLEALRREKDRATKKKLEQEIKQVEQSIERRRSFFKTFPTPDGKPDTPFIVWDHRTPAYSFGCRQLPPNYLEGPGSNA